MTRVEMMLGLAFFGFAVSAIAAEPARQKGGASKEFVVKFATSAFEVEDEHRYRTLTFSLDKKLNDSHVTVFDLRTGTVESATAALMKEAPEEFAYRARLRPGPSEEPNDLAFLLPAVPRAASINLRRSDEAAVERLTSPHFEKVLSVARKGIDTDGDRIADVAFLTACVEYAAGDGICASEITFAARRSAGRWLLTSFCADVQGLCPADP